MCKVEYRMLWIAKSPGYGMAMDFNFHFRHTVFTLVFSPASVFSTGNSHVNYYWNSAVAHKCPSLVAENALLLCLGTKMGLGKFTPSGHSKFAALHLPHWQWGQLTAPFVPFLRVVSWNRNDFMIYPQTHMLSYHCLSLSFISQY